MYAYFIYALVLTMLKVVILSEFVKYKSMCTGTKFTIQVLLTNFPSLSIIPNIIRSFSFIGGMLTLIFILCSFDIFESTLILLIVSDGIVSLATTKNGLLVGLFVVFTNVRGIFDAIFCGM